MKPQISLSSCWCSGRHRDGYQMAREMADMGFEFIELSHGIRITLVPGILRAVQEGMIKISSTHNFCPLPPGVNQPAPNLFTPTAAENREHQQWLRHTRRSLEFAAQVHAPCMITHMGNVPLWRKPGRRLKEYLEKKPDTDVLTDAKYKKLVEKGFNKIRKKIPPYWEQLRHSMVEILPDAERCGVKIGAENRESFEELPLDNDFEEFFKQFNHNKFLGWWHDTGHARIKERLGILDHKKYLEAHHKQLLGFHLHDVDAEGRDHQALGVGVIDFEMISGFFRNEHILVLELSPRLAPEEVLQSKARLESLISKATGKLKS